MSQGKPFNFDQEGVTVVIPEQARRLKAVRLPLESLDKMKAKEGGFQPGRLLMNFAVVDETQPEEVLTEFDPPFELRVRYTPGDLRRAERAGQPLQLAFWDGNEWVVLTPEKHQFELQPAASGQGGGFGVARISHWGDPHIAWGP